MSAAIIPNKNNETNECVSYAMLDDRLRSVTNYLHNFKEASGKTTVEQAIELNDPVCRLLQQSDAEFEKIYNEGHDLLTNIKIANDQGEIQRREEDDQRMQSLYNKIDVETIQSKAELENLFNGLTKIHGKNMKNVFVMHDAIGQQKLVIDKIVQAKDETIDAFRREIERVDKDFAGYSRRQDINVRDLCGRVNGFVDTMRAFFKEKLLRLENTLEEEHEKYRSNASAEWLQRYEGNDKECEKNIEKRTEQIKTNDNVINRIKAEHEELCRATYIKMEAEKQNILSEMRQFKAFIILNAEKMKYSSKVLNQMGTENVFIQNFEKHKLMKLKRNVLIIQKKIIVCRQSSAIKIKELIRDVSRIRSSIGLHQQRFSDVLKRNDDHFWKIWRVNEIESDKLLQRAYGIERVLYEQFLEMEWKVPALENSDIIKKIESIKLVEHKSFSNNSDNKNPSVESLHPEYADIDVECLLFSKLSDISGFLLNEKLQSILQPYSDIDRSVITVENVFKAFGISNTDHMNKLKSCFLEYLYCPNCPDAGIPSADKGVLVTDTRPLIAAENFDESLNDFIQQFGCGIELHRNIQTAIDPPMNLSSVDLTNIENIESIKHCPNHITSIKTADVFSSIRNFVQSHNENGDDVYEPELPANKEHSYRSLTEEEIQTFWNNYNMAMDGRNKRVWSTFENGLNQYLMVLKRRKILEEECELLRRQNIELKHCLQNYRYEMDRRA